MANMCAETALPRSRSGANDWVSVFAVANWDMAASPMSMNRTTAPSGNVNAFGSNREWWIVSRTVTGCDGGPA